MKIHLSGFLQKNQDDLDLKGNIDDKDLNLSIDNIDLVGLVAYKGNIFNVGKDNMINLDLDFSYREDCSRCLSSSVNKISTNLYAKLIDISNRSEETEDSVDEDICYYEDEILDLAELIRSQLITSIPMKSLCNEDCKGLCPSCGVDLNKDTCTCDDHLIDPRFAVLKDFFPEE